MTSPRVVAAEILDGLDPEDPAARRSRRDLRRVHRIMGTRRILRQALLPYGAGGAEGVPLQVLELGAGDGTLMLGVARHLHAEWPPVRLTLLDQADLIEASTVSGYESIGWRVTTAVSDVLKWAQADEPRRWDLIIANLFLHHFATAQLALLLGAIAARTRGFFACEPRRSQVSLLGSHLIGAIGANAVTRADSVASVRAGFCDHELEAIWHPAASAWDVQEYSAGLFSHCFHARRNEGALHAC
jgi:hypothetical protein